MKTRLNGFLCFIALLFFGSLHAQWKKPEFADITPEEIAYQQCPFEKTADAVVLFDSGESFFIDGVNGIEMVFVKHIKIKILTDAGVKAASFQIPLFEGKGGIENLYNVKGFSFNTEGGVVKKRQLEQDAIYEDRINERWKAQRLTFPDVRVGTIVELEYSISSPYVFEFRDWDFQSNYPVLLSQYKVRMIPFYEYIYLIKGNVRKIQRKSYEDVYSKRGMFGTQFNEMVYEFRASDLPGLATEEFAPSSNDHNTRVDFQLCTVIHPRGGKDRILTTWEELVDDYLNDELFGKFVKKAAKWGEKNLPVDSLSRLADREKMEYVVDFVKKNFSSDGALRWSLGQKSFNDFIKQRDGNTANINLMTVGLLKATGLDALPVILSTRLNGEIAYDYPFRHYFDYTVALVRLPSGLMLIDATDPVIPVGELPLKCYNGKGLIVEEGKPEWCSLALPGHSAEKSFFDLAFNGSDTALTLNIRTELTGFPASELRSKLLVEPENVEQFYKNNLLNEVEEKVVIHNQDEINKPLTLEAKVKIPFRKMNNRWVIHPFWGQNTTVNPFKATQRSLPIVLPYTGNRSFVFTMELPEHVIVKQLPESKNLAFSGVSLQYGAALNGQKIVVSGQYAITKSFFSVDEYAEIRFFYIELIRIFNQELIVESTQL